jgi:hypothetical protein
MTEHAAHGQRHEHQQVYLLGSRNGASCWAVWLRQTNYTCGPNGARWTISMRVPQGSVM